jgi:hypothetical protein
MRRPFVAEYIRCRRETANCFCSRFHVSYYTFTSGFGQTTPWQYTQSMSILPDGGSVRYTEVMVKQSSKKTTKKTVQRVDFEPNKMGLAIAALAAVSLVLVAVMAMQA